jgi:outer membrane immunogenic protein
MSIKNSVLWLLAGLASTGAAQAAEDWSGPYVGGSVGYSTGDSQSSTALGGAWSTESAGLRTDFTNIMNASLEPDGGTYGLYAGFDVPLSTHWVLGGEVSYDGANTSARRAPGPQASATFPSLTYAPVNTVDVSGMFSARARLGYAFENTLAYATVGYASADAEMSTAVLSSGNYSKRGVKSDWLNGVSYGAGLEFRMGPNWSFRGEYQRVDLGDLTYTTDYRPGSSFVSPAYTETVTQDLTLNSFKLGASFHF